MIDSLAAILEGKRKRVTALAGGAARLRDRARSADRPRPFLDRLRRDIASRGIALICEFKRRSPSAGIINADADPAQVAATYRDHGASALSILTDEKHFGAHPRDLARARAACDLPILRKDFLLDPLQVIESRAMGADAVLVILSALADDEAAALCECAGEWGMAALVEVHDAAELERALALPSPLIGINNRDLRTLVTDLGVGEQLARRVPNDRIAVAESGIRTPYDLDRLRRAGARAFLIGESLMRADIGPALLRALAEQN